METNTIETARKNLLTVEKKLNELVIGHEDFIRALMLSVVAGEHLVVIGAPGTAKSYAIRTLSILLEAKFYSYLLTRFTSYDELFGTIDVAELAKSGTFKRNWSKIIDSDFIFLDEIFKANSAILNSLLSILQERIVYDPITGQPLQASVHTCVGASNEVPEDPELLALYDRFAVKVFVDYIDNDALILRALQARWLNNHNSLPLATMQDVKILNNYAEKLITARIKELGEVYKLYHINTVPLVKSLRSQGVIVSDRTIIEKLPKLFTAYLALYGVTIDNVMNAVFDIITYTARSKEEVTTIRKAIDDSLGEVAELAKKLEKAREFVKAGNLSQAKSVLAEIINTDINTLASKTPWLKPRVEAIVSNASQLLKNIQSIEEQISRLAGETQ
ncbi:MAG: AAA family ATPase [Thermofilum sp.]|uniref:AAA family ATPase n=1 Tax=Thermofilum sp. TaxID=1961369 RepID=UPI003174DF42